MKNKLKILLVVMVLVFALAGISAAAAATSGSCGDSLTWIFNESDGVLTISGTGEMDDYMMGLLAPWGKYHSSLREIVVEEGVTTIGKNAFSTLQYVSNVSLPESLTAIGEGAFDFCTALKEVVIPSKVTYLEDETFYSCHSLRRVVIPKSVTGCGDRVFDTGTATVIEGYMGSYAEIIANEYELEFSPLGNVAATTVATGKVNSKISWKIDNYGKLTITGTGEIPDYSPASAYPWYSYMDDIKRIEFGEGITKIGKAFNSLENLRIVVFSDTVTEIVRRAFAYCDNLDSVTIPPSVETIGDDAFYSANYLTIKGYSYTAAEDYAKDNYITFVSLGEAEFEILASGKLTDSISWRVDSRRVLTVSGSGSAPDFAAKEDVPWYEYCDVIQTIVLDGEIENIGAYYFFAFTRLEEVTLPASVSKVGDYAFYSNSSLKTVNVKGTLTHIGDYAFYSNKAIAQFPFNEGLVEIGSYSFYDTMLSSVTTPSTLKSIGSYAFYKCTYLTSVTLTDNITYMGDAAFSNTRITSLTIPKGVTVINASLAASSDITTLILHNDITEIGNSAFSGTSVKEVILPEKLTKIGTSAFRDTNIKHIDIPEGVTELGEDAFYSCDYLTEATIPSTVKTVAPHLFELCHNLEKIAFKPGVETIGERSFRNCTALTSVILPETVTTLGTEVFIGCSGLKEVKLSTAITEIPRGCFDGCSAITTITLHEGLTKIGLNAFDEAFDNVDITIPSTVKEIESDAFRSARILKLIFEGGNVSLGYEAFASCKVTAIEFNDANITFGYNSFYNCGSLTELYIPETMTKSIGTAAFSWCKKLEKVVIASEKIQVYDEAFKNCTALKEVEFAHGIKNIAKDTFAGCTALEKVTIPYSVQSIKPTAFNTGSQNTVIYGYTYSIAENYVKVYGGTYPVTFVALGETPEMVLDSGEAGKGTWSLDTRGVLTITGNEIIRPSSTAGWSNYTDYIEKIIITEGVHVLYGTNVAACTYLEAIDTHYDLIYSPFGSNIPEGVTVYGYEGSWAQSAAEENKLNFVSKGVMPEGAVVEGVIEEECGTVRWTIDSEGTLTLSGKGEVYNYGGVYDFPWYDYNSAIKALIVEKGVTKVPTIAFYSGYYPVLVDVTVHNSVIDFDCSKLMKDTRIHADEYSMAANTAENAGMMVDYTGVTPDSVIYSGVCGESLTWHYTNRQKLIIAGQGDMTSAPWRGLPIKETELPEGLTSICANAFYGQSMEAVEIPDSVTVIGNGAFQDCRNLKRVILPEKLTAIPNKLFYNCIVLEEVEISSATRSIKYDSFNNTPMLKNIYYTGTETMWNNNMSGNSYIYSKTVHFGQKMPFGGVSVNYVTKTSYGARVKITVKEGKRGGMAVYNADRILIGVVELSETGEHRLDDEAVYIKVFAWDKYSLEPAQRVYARVIN